MRCEPGDGAVAQMTLAVFSDPDALEDAWVEHLGGIQPSLEDTSSACEESTVGVRRWGFGTLACSLEDGSAMISWTDSRSDLLGILHGVGPDLGELHARWQDEAKPLGRIADIGPSSSDADADQPLVRAPGAPTEVICTSLDEPLVDPHGRRWRIERVRFLDRADYERVVFVLERTGDVRAGQTTMVTVDPMPAEAVTAAVPDSPPPSRGRTALVVRMQGVTQAPDLQAYRPEGMDLVKELSIVRGAGSRTAILALHGDGCYQVRIPVFGPSATGDEDRAEIFIDVPTGEVP